MPSPAVMRRLPWSSEPRTYFIFAGINGENGTASNVGRKALKARCGMWGEPGLEYARFVLHQCIGDAETVPHW